DYYALDEIKEESEEFKDEPRDEFADIKQEEPVLNAWYLNKANEIKEEPMEIKEEPIDEFKQEEPISDILCPSTGTSHPVGGPVTVTEVALKTKMRRIRRVKCVVCHRLCNRAEMNRFTMD
ncbi:hypothetical protein PMAYCL1PPCAC_19560, partial [Pristionchus mayeri]